MLIAFEGLDGCGKSTQIKHIEQWLKNQNKKVYSTFEPSKGSIGSFIRAQLTSTNIDEKALGLLFASDRLQHLKTEIQPHLNQGYIVLCDRYVLSSLAYQAQVLPMDWIYTINQHAQKPDATLFFNIAPELALERLEQRQHEVTRFENLSRLQAVAQAYKDAIEKYPQLGKYYTIDAAAPKNTVSQQTETIVKTILNLAS